MKNVEIGYRCGFTEKRRADRPEIPDVAEN